MNTNKYILWCSCWITIFVGIVSILVVKHVEYQVTSSPVEEMYHTELVNTLDSILDARYIDNTTFSCDSVCECME